ncbi:MAG: hypothetical protein ACI30I_04275 [Parabacteroides sp.]
MKKIMFNDKYGLTKAVLEGRKTQTRRAISGRTATYMLNYKNSHTSSNYTKEDINKVLSKFGSVISPYKVGDIVAIAQSYKNCGIFNDNEHMKLSSGWSNKMFVRADLMPHHIKIERVRVEQLQDISKEDCLKEGVCFYENTPSIIYRYDHYTPWPVDIKPYKYDADNRRYYATARYAFACLIDKTSGKGTWNNNPLVFVYDFKLID